MPFLLLILCEFLEKVLKILFKHPYILGSFLAVVKLWKTGGLDMGKNYLALYFRSMIATI